MGVKILGGITIGDIVYIAPNAGVDENVDSNNVHGGIPAKNLNFKK